MSDAEIRAACLANWPDAENGSYNPSCCRFPKSCSIPTDTTHLVPVTARPLPPGRVRAAVEDRGDGYIRVGHYLVPKEPLNFPPAPSAGQDTGRLLTLVADDLRRHGDDWPLARQFARRIDRGISPAVRQLIAERDEARAQVQRVAAVVDERTGHGGWVSAQSIRRALDGPT